MAEGELYIERRKHKRLDKKYRVNYKVIMAEEELKEIKKSMEKQHGETTDISMGGIKVLGQMLGEQGDIVRLEIVVEGRQVPITTFAEVKWAKNAGEGKKEFGVEFLILKEADRKFLEEMIDEGEGVH